MFCEINYSGSEMKIFLAGDLMTKDKMWVLRLDQLKTTGEGHIVSQNYTKCKNLNRL